MPVNLDVAIEQRLPESVEVAAYYVVAEALTNAAKHAHASEVKVRAHATDESLDLFISDDGIGGADSRKGSGLIGLKRPYRGTRRTDARGQSSRRGDSP